MKIYALIDPISSEIKYVGKTYRRLDIRLREHVYDCIRRPKSSHKVNWIKMLISKNKIPIIRLLENTKKENAEERERYWVAKSRLDGNNLTNSTEGGEFCTTGSTLSEDVREYMSKVAKKRSKGSGNTMWGRKHKESSKRKMSKMKMGIYEGTNNPRSRKVFEYNTDNVLIKEWSHCKECADYYKISRGNLSSYAKYNTNMDDDINVVIKKFKLLKGIVFKFK